jgi:hypothetical protein
MRKIAVLATLSVLGLTTAATAQEVTLRAVTAFAEKTTYSRGFERFIERVNETGKGVIRINYIGGPKAMPPFEVGNALKNGVVDIANATGAFYTNVMPEADAWKLRQVSMAELRKNGGFDYMAGLYAQKMNAVFLANMVGDNPFHLYPTSPASSCASPRSIATSSRRWAPPWCRPRRARSTPRSSVAWSTAMAGPSPASSISAGTRRPSIASIRASTPRRSR